MNKTTWYSILVMIIVSNTYAMELNRWDETARLLPLLSTTNAWTVPSALLQGRSQQIGDSYQEAFNCRDVRGALMAQDAIISTREEVRNGKTILEKRSVLQDSRIPYALGVLSMQEGYKEEAIQQFMGAERAVGYKPHEMPVYHAARFARFLLENQHDKAYGHLVELQKLTPFYPTFNEVAKVQRHMLADAQYLPLLKELAAEGSVDAQFEVLKKACHEATKSTVVEDQADCIKSCAIYFQNLDAYPEFRPLLEVVTSYIKGIREYKEGSGQTAIKILGDLLKEETKDVSIQEVQQLSCNLLKALAAREDISARSYFAAQQIISTNRNERLRGFEALAKILEEKKAEDGSIIQNIFGEFDLRALIESHANNGQTVASCVCAQLTCHELFKKDAVTKEEYAVLKKYATNGNTKKCTQVEMMQSIARFCDLMILRKKQAVSVAVVNKCIEMVKAKKPASTIEQIILAKASATLDELAEQGLLDAQTWQLATRIQKDTEGKAIQPETVTYCLAVAKRLLEADQAELITDNGTRVVAALTQVAAKGNCYELVDPKLIAEARYLKSRYLFRLLHRGREAIGLLLDQSKGLDTLYLEANSAARADVTGAQAFVKAVGLYRKALMLYADRKDEVAVDVLLNLLALDLPVREKELCTNYCTYALRISAETGIHKAVAWQATTLLQEKNYALLFKQMTNACEPIFQNVFAGDSLDEWGVEIIPYATNGIFDAIGALEKKGQASLDAPRALFISMASLVQASTPHKMFSNENSSKEELLQVALVNAQEAYALACKDEELSYFKKNYYKNWLGIVCSTVGNYYADARNFGNVLVNDTVAQRKNLEYAEKIFLEGAALKHPQCITSAACIALDTPRSVRPMTRDDFIAHTRSLYEAAELKDKYAGARLAEHLFDGAKLPFGCGYSLQSDIQKAIQIAGKMGGEYPECQRIIGYHCYQAVAKSPKGQKGQAQESEKLIDQAIMLLAGAANKEYRPAYYHFREMVNLGVCTPAQVTQIHDFLNKKAMQNRVDAMAVYGSILSERAGRVDEGIALLLKARELSDGHIGSTELLTVFNAHPNKNDLLYHAVECALVVLESLENIDEIERLGIFKLLPLLEAALQVEDQREKALAYSQKLRAVFEQHGISVETISPEGVSPEGFGKVVQEVGEKDDHPATSTPELVRVPPLVTDDFLRGLGEMARAFQNMDSSESQRILKDTVLMEALEAGAHAENALAQCLFSKVLAYKAEHNVELQEDMSLKKGQYRQALIVGASAFMNDPENTSLMAEYERVHIAFCNFYASRYIPALKGDRKKLSVVYGEFMPLLSQLKLNGILPDQMILFNATYNCIEVLAQNGCVEALFSVVNNYLHSARSEDHNKALEALYRCGAVYELESAQALREMGLFDMYQKNITRIRELAERGNKHAALVLVFYESFNVKCNNIKDVGVLKQSLKNVLKYCGIAKKQKLPAGIHCWYKGQLLNPERMQRKEFDTALKELEAIAEKEVAAGELAMIMCGTTMQFPCGQKGLNDRRRCKKIALRIKDKSIEALKTLAQYAQEDGEYKNFLLYKLEIVKRLIHKPLICYMELAQNCAVANLYPDEIITYLQHQMDNGSVEAKLALAGIGIKRKEFEESMALVEQVIEAGGFVAHLARLEAAFAHLDRSCPLFNIKKGLEKAKIGIAGLIDSDLDKKIGIDSAQAFAMGVMKLLLWSLTQHTLEYKEDLYAGLDDIIDLLASNKYCHNSSVEWSLLMAIRHCNVGSAYWIIKTKINAALDQLKHSTNKEVDKAHIGTAVSILLSKLQAKALAAGKEDASQKIEDKAAIQDLTTLADKNGITYHII